MVNNVKRESIWCKDIKVKDTNILDKDLIVDVLIIGGGLTGINTAYYLKDSDLKVAIIEQGYVGMGVTSKTTGKINYLQETIYSDLVDKYSIEIAGRYLESQRFAIEEISKIIKKEKIECNLEKVRSFVYTNNEKEIDKIKRERDVLESLGVEVLECLELNNNLNSLYGISVNDTYVFHPLKYLYGLKKVILDKGIAIYEQTRIKEMKKNDGGYLCYGDGFKIKASKVILACHYPFFLKPYMMPLKVYTEKSYIVASKSKRVLKENYITSTKPVKSMRYHRDGKDKYVLYLTNSHNICNDLDDEDNFNDLLREAKVFGLKPEYIWSNDDIMSIDRMPYIGRIEKGNDNLLIGTGYSTWGMTNSLVAGFILSNMVRGIKTECDELFDPLRVNLSDCLVNIGSSLKSIVENKIDKNKNWYSDNVKFEVRNGKNVAIYNDGNKEHIVLSDCPHMGCTLIFNEVEKTWDCPCHASKFDLDGKCIKGPSSYDITYKEES